LRAAGSSKGVRRHPGRQTALGWAPALGSRVFLHPDLALRGGFLFPDRRDLLELIDAPFAGPERLGSMLRGCDYQNDVLTDLNVAIPMNNQQLQYIEILEGPLADLAKFSLRHALVLREIDAR